MLYHVGTDSRELITDYSADPHHLVTSLELSYQRREDNHAHAKIIDNTKVLIIVLVEYFLSFCFDYLLR